MKRDSVLFYRTFAESIRELPEDQQLEVFWAIVNYGLDGEAPENGVPAAILAAFKHVIDKNNRKFENRMNKTKQADENEQEQTGTNENKQEQTKNKQEQTGTNGGEKGERRKEK